MNEKAQAELVEVVLKHRGLLEQIKQQMTGKGQLYEQALADIIKAADKVGR